MWDGPSNNPVRPITAPPPTVTTPWITCELAPNDPQSLSLQDGRLAALAGSDAVVCATVRLQIQQDAVLTRTAFLASLEFDNGTAGAIEGLELMLDIRDMAGNAANDLFGVRGPDALGLVRTASGWTVAANSLGTLAYTLVPTVDAAVREATRYSVGGTLRYVENGQVVEIALTPSRINVYPEAKLELDYFWQRDVIGDDPFTDAVEESQPFALGLQVRNVGFGAARNVAITSAQPEIVENEKGLLVDFQIVSSSVQDKAAAKSLTITLGQLAPASMTTAQWNLESSLQGRFSNYNASFQQLDNFGNVRTALIQSVNVHELIRSLQVSLPGSSGFVSDGIPDFLVNDLPDERNAPDMLYLSNGVRTPVGLAANASLSGTGVERTLTADASSGWSYLQLPDPLPGYKLVSVVRSDGKALAVDQGSGGMVWRTDRSFPQGQSGAVAENLLHLVDLDSTGSYTLRYQVQDNRAPELMTLEGGGGIALRGLLQSAPDALVLVFSEAMDLASIGVDDLQITRDGQPLSLPALSINTGGTNKVQISGLAGVLGVDGNYRLTVAASGMQDTAGNAGTNTLQARWALGLTAPVVVELTDPGVLRNAPLNSLEVTFSRDMDAGSIQAEDLLLVRDGQTLVLGTDVRVITVDARTYRFTGLALYTQAEGAYSLSLSTGGMRDTQGVAGVGVAERSWRMDTTGPTPVAVQQVSTNVRNTVVRSLDVSFSDAVADGSFSWSDISIMRTVGAVTSAELSNPDVVVERIDDRTFRISNFTWNTGLDGRYTLTVHGSGVRDAAGNAGSGQASSSWVMDTVRPLPASGLRISPDSGESATDRLTNTPDLVLSGTLPEDGMRVRLTDATTNTELGLAVVEGRSFTAQLSLQGSGVHDIRVRTVDAAGNISPDGFIRVFIDTTAPSVASIDAVTPALRTTPVQTVSLRMDEAVLQFGREDITLTRDGALVELGDTVTVQALANNQWRIEGLGLLTSPLGQYQLTVSATGIQDRAGNTGVGQRSISWTHAQVVPGRIDGLVFEDLDGSGTYNSEAWNVEAAIAGRTVYLDADRDGVFDEGEQSTVTDAQGRYSFVGLAAGSYVVTQVVPEAWLVTTPGLGAVVGSYSVNLAEGSVVTGADFGNFKTATLSGVKFHDRDADGNREAGEEVLSGWTIFLDRDADGELDAGEASVVTGADGAFSFSGVGPGTVQIGEVVQAGWQRTTPAAPYAVKSGLQVVADLGNVQLSSITGVKFNDLNGNGARDAGDLGVQGWTIFLDSNTNGVLEAGERSTLTDALGNYRFENLLPGSYTVAEVQRQGWVQTKPLPSAIPVGIETANSLISMEVDCACGGTWAAATGPSMIDYGKLAIDTALSTVGISSLRQGNVTLDGRGTTTVVIDTGIDLDHRFFGPDLNGNGVADRIVYQWDFADNDADASDASGHGSHIASLIGAADNLYGGVAPGTNLIALKVFKNTGEGTFGYLEKALQWVLANRVQYGIGVINLSLGDSGNWTNEFSRYGIGDELAALARTDVIVVAAAGNNYLQFGRIGVAYPASDPAAIAVGATWAADFGGPWHVSTGAINYTTGVDQIAAFSQRDPELLDTFAPGARFNGATKDGGVRTMQGTSQAAAFVSGAAAIAQQIAHNSLGRGLSTAEFAQLLRASGQWITDGDDEIDNVVNTGEHFKRMDFAKLATLIGSLDDPTTGGGKGAGSGGGGGGGGTQPVQLLAENGVHNVRLGAGQQVGALEFGNFQLGEIAGTVFADTDRSASQNPGEGGVAGQTVYLDANGNASFDEGERSTLTNAVGGFRFDALAAGTVTVRTVLPAYTLATTEASQTVQVLSGLQRNDLHFGQLTGAAPQATGDTATTDEDTPINLMVQDNDSTAGVLGLQITAGQATYGQISVAEDGSLRYTPDANFHGADSLSYTLTDQFGRSATASVMVTVRPVNDAPVLQSIPDQVIGDGQTLSLQLQASDVDGDALRFSLEQAPAGATLDERTGQLRWSAPQAAAQQQFTLKATDASGASASQSFSVKVELGRLVVTSFQAQAWGFAVRFNDVIDQSTLNLYGAGTPAADVVVTGALSGQVKGSVVIDPDGKGLTFVRTGAQFAADSYTVVIRGADDALVNARRGALDGDANGKAGGNYSASFSVGATGNQLRLPDFARGPGQVVNIPASASGMPVTLRSDGTVRDLSFRLVVDAASLNVTEIRRGADLPADASLVVTPVAGQPGQFDVRISRATALPAGTLKLLSLIAEVPATAPLGKTSVITVQNVSINGAAAPQAGDAALQAVAYLGDLNLDGKYDASDVALLGRLGTRLDSGLAALDDVDPLIAADIDGNGVINAIDTALLNLRTRAASTPVIPAIPVLPPPAVLTPLAASQPLLATSLSADRTTQTALQAVSAKQINLNSTAASFAIKRSTTAVTPVLPSASALSALRVSLGTSSVGVNAGSRLF